jgi:hypothetical protein
VGSKVESDNVCTWIAIPWKSRSAWRAGQVVNMLDLPRRVSARVQSRPGQSKDSTEVDSSL